MLSLKEEEEISAEYRLLAIELVCSCISLTYGEVFSKFRNRNPSLPKVFFLVVWACFLKLRNIMGEGMIVL